MKKLSVKLRKPGIYCIINISNNKRYVGSTKNIFQRLSCHRSYLRKGVHQNSFLQNSWNKYGECNFDFYVLEFCSEENLIEREQYYIDFFQSEYNLTKIVDRNILSAESRLKQSVTRTEKIRTGEIVVPMREIYKYDLNGNYICKYKSVRSAAKENNISVSSINRFTSGKYKKAGLFLWSYDFVESMEAYIKFKKHNCPGEKKVLLLDYKSKKVLLEFDSIVKCANHFNSHASSISYAIKVFQKFKKQYMIIYKPA